VASRLCRLASMATLVLALQSTTVWGQQTPAQNAFAVRDASVLMEKIARAVQSNQRDKLLSAFDLTHMSEGRIFRQQITSFLSHYDYIRVHFNLTRVAMDGEKGMATVEAEMEADPPNVYTQPIRKHATLHFTAEPTSSGWKFIDVQPRDFFSSSRAAAAPARGTSPPR
jgi:hypothetical protein